MTTKTPTAARPAAASEELLGKALDRTLLLRIFSYVWPYRTQMLLAIGLLPLIALFEIAQPYLLKKAIDEHIAIGRLEGLNVIGLLYLGAMVGQYGIAFVQAYLTQVIGQRGMNDLRTRTHGKLLSLSASFFDRTPVGRLMTRLTSDIESLNEMFASGIVSLVGDVIRLAFILVAIFAIDWRLALFSMGTAPVLFALAAYFRRWVRDAFREIRVKLARMNSFLQEHLSGMKVVQAFAQESKVDREFDEINVDYRRANARAIAADAALYAIVEAVGSVAVAGLLWHGGSRIAGGTLTFGVLVAFIEYLTKFFAPIRDLSTKYTVMQQAMAAAERVFSLIDTDEPDAVVGPSTSTSTTEHVDGCAAWSWIRLRSGIGRIGPCCRSCRWRFGRGRRWRLSARRGRANPRSSSCCRASTKRSRGSYGSKGSTFARWIAGPCAGGSSWSARTSSCSRERCATTSRWGRPTARLDRRRDPGGGAAGGGRSGHRGAARGAGRPGARAWREFLRRRAAAHRLRPRAGPAARGADPR